MIKRFKIFANMVKVGEKYDKDSSANVFLMGTRVGLKEEMWDLFTALQITEGLKDPINNMDFK